MQSLGDAIRREIFIALDCLRLAWTVTSSSATPGTYSIGALRRACACPLDGRVGGSGSALGLIFGELLILTTAVKHCWPCLYEVPSLAH
jgi:hypothetical protein